MSSLPAQNELGDFHTLFDWIRFAASHMEANDCFYGQGFDTAWMEASYLVLRSIKLEWNIPESAYSAQTTQTERDYIYNQIEKRCVGKIPTAYLVEEAWFCHEPFRVTPDVLIPRSPIAELIEQRFEPWLTSEPTRVLDLCTGSGCIGIAMARAFPDTKVDVSDLSESAIDIAIDNINSKDLGFQVDAYTGDLFQALEGNRYDLIVSNPPYVDTDDIDSMPAEFEHEPRLGLIAGDDGLEIVHQILSQAGKFLTEGGWLVCEVGNSAAALIDAYPNIAFDWPEFTFGGQGVFVVSAQQLNKHSMYQAIN